MTAEDAPGETREEAASNGDAADETPNDDEMPGELRAESDVAVESDAAFDADAERRELLREVAEDVYGDSSESRQLSAVLYRVSDLYDPDEATSPEEIYLNVRHIMDIKDKGGLRTD